MRQLLEWQQDSRDALEFVENIKLDLFTDEVFVFTPRGDVIDLPSGAIPLDFAYRIHTDIGNRCVGCRVSGRLVPLDYVLKTGDIVEIITSKQGSPSRDWLKMVKTSTARSRIRAWFKKERREENIEKGRELLEKGLRRQGTNPSYLLKDSLIEAVGNRFNIHNADDLYAAVGYGGVSTNQVIGRLKEEYAKKYGSEEKLVLPEFGKKTGKALQGDKGVCIHGLDNILTRFARCCNPVPGDEIQGVVTMGRGISVHRKDCINIRGDKIAPERLVDASWLDDPDTLYPVEIEISASDRPRLLSDIVSAISEKKINITAVEGRTDRNFISTINLVMMVKDHDHLQQIINNIKKVEDVISVRRHTST